MSLIILSTSKKPTSGFPNYASFETWVNSQAVVASVDIDTSATPYGEGYNRATIKTLSGNANAGGITYFGTSYGSRFLAGGNRGLQAVAHAMPSATVYDANLNRKCLIKVNASEGDTASLVRNGVTATGIGNRSDALQSTDFIYWDSVLSKAMRCNPFTTSPPIEFTGTL